MKKLNYIQIFGERNSGTNYLHKLIEKNIQDIEVGYKYGWKHGYTNLKTINSSDTQKTLFIHITKDPYAWISSMHDKPHHAPQLYFMNFSEFIKTEWACYKGKQYQVRAKNLEAEPLKPEEEMLKERDPITGKRFKNVCQLRNAKMHRFIKLEDHVENYLHIKYEDLLFQQETVFRNLSSRFNLNVNKKLKNDSGYHGKDPNKSFTRQSFYSNKEYMDKYNEEDIKFVNTELKFKNENSLGYKLNKAKK